MDLLTTLGRQFHAAQNLVRSRASRNPNDVIEQRTTTGEHIADAVARFGGSWRFIMMSQNRQDAKDRLRGELDFEVNRRAEAEIHDLTHRLSLLDEKFDDLQATLREKKSQ